MHGWGLTVRATRENKPFRLPAPGWGLTIRRVKKGTK